MVRIFAHKEHPDAVIPEVAYNNTSACFDITCIEDTLIPAKGSAIVPNGLNLSIDQTEKYMMQVQLRSSMGFKRELTLHAGIFDPGYTGSVSVKIYNLGDENVIIKKGDRYAQMAVTEIPHHVIIELDDEGWERFKGKQFRGDKGFGSSGK